MMKDRVAIGASDWLALAAAPVFALMAVLTTLADDGDAGLLCGQTGGPSVLTGMTPMYLLMAAFHLVPWLRLGRWRS